MIIAIVGTRECGNVSLEEIISKIHQGCTGIISGGAKGIDSLAKSAAQSLKVPFEQILPCYEKFGKRAPIVRNAEIVKQADRVLAFWDFKSRGTANVLALCIEQGVPVDVIAIAEERDDR